MLLGYHYCLFLVIYINMKQMTQTLWCLLFQLFGMYRVEVRMELIDNTSSIYLDVQLKVTASDFWVFFFMYVFYKILLNISIKVCLLTIERNTYPCKFKQMVGRPYFQKLRRSFQSEMQESISCHLLSTCVFISNDF